MSRYVHDLETHKAKDEVTKITEEYLEKEGFKKTTYKGEECWKKGMGVLTGPQYVKVEPAEGKVHIEGWIQFAVLPGVYVGEMDTSGALAIIPKRKLKGRIEELEKKVA